LEEDKMDISIAEAHNRLSALLKQVEKEPVTITRRGKAVGVLISPGEYESLNQVRAYLQMINLAHTLRESAAAGEIYRASRAELEDES
jgi:prevent-host-death family protein